MGWGKIGAAATALGAPPGVGTVAAGRAGNGGWYGKAGRGNIKGAAEDVSNNLGFGNRKANEAAGKLSESQRQQRGETEGVLGSMSANDQQYKSQRDTQIRGYYEDLDELKKNAESQASDARSVYTGTVQPEMKNIMERAKSEAGNAMTLQQAGDPNNAVQQSVRKMYNDQGEQARRQGQADFGVLSALGAQAAGQQFGAAGPMTAGMQGQIYAQNQSQAGEAYARAQQQMQRLREQGIESGFRESNNQYNRGQDAIDRYGNSVKNIQNADETYQDRMGRFRDEIGGNRREKFGIGMGQASDNYNIDQGQQQRKLGMLNDFYGGQQAGYAGQVARENAGQAGKMGMLGQLAGAGIGAIAGGPAGASAGSQIGGQAAGAAAAGNQAPAPQPAANYGVSGAMNNGGYYDYGDGANYPRRPGAQYSYSPGAYGGGYGPRGAA